jgi:integrase
LRKEIRTVARERTGGIVERKDGRIFARITHIDEDGRRRQIMRAAKSRTEARRTIKRMYDEIDKVGASVVDADKRTFADVAKDYKSVRLQPARYVGERKVAGVRSLRPALDAYNALVSYFGKRRVKSIKHSDIERYKLHRLDTPTIHNKPRSITSVNRELQLLRAVFRFAIREGVMLRSPFELGAPLISVADERKRERILSYAEETRLLASCINRRAHIRPLIITALDTGMRRGELFALRWSDIDFASGIISIRATTTKTLSARTVGMTTRVREELQRLRDVAPDDPQRSVFGIKDTVKTGFMAALREAGIESLRFHDLRHTAITRMIEGGMKSPAVMKISGHTQMTTFIRYVNPNTDAVRNGAEMLDAYNTAQAAASAEKHFKVEVETVN